jgi:4-aminobutyrate aminotransferase/diaminobutyrate-pyruvate transaminase/4-aminobutyrate aminotransferase/(S)-3-amino-2-methylpropionate transaminase
MAESKEQHLIPRKVPEVETSYRRIRTAIPVPESIPLLQQLRTYEPRSMGGQPLVVWDYASGIQVHDRWGNKWLDWSSGVLVTNSGHNHPRIARAMVEKIEHGLVHNYCFPTAERAELTRMLAESAPEGMDKVFLLTTGSEATECAIKLARTHGIKVGGTDKIVIVTFDNAFHGRTLGAQMAGGIPSLKNWIVNLDKDMVQVPFPDGFRGGPDQSFDVFIKALELKGINPENVAGVMTETYQGGNASFAPPEYMQQLRRWCGRHNALLIMDEVQAGFGRTGKFWGFEHYDLVPDLICCGKGISSGMPLSAVIGSSSILDMYPPGSMTSTHTGNPVCAPAAIANLGVIKDECLVSNSRRMGEILQPELRRLGEKFGTRVGAVHGKGLVAAMHMVKPSSTDPDPDLAAKIVRLCVEKGLLMFAPVGYGGASVKISPPLIITEEPLRESIDVLDEAMEEAIGE